MPHASYRIANIIIMSLFIHIISHRPIVGLYIPLAGVGHVMGPTCVPNGFLDCHLKVGTSGLKEVFKVVGFRQESHSLAGHAEGEDRPVLKHRTVLTSLWWMSHYIMGIFDYYSW